jgi:hypothetical protein
VKKKRKKPPHHHLPGMISFLGFKTTRQMPRMVRQPKTGIQPPHNTTTTPPPTENDYILFVKSNPTMA